MPKDYNKPLYINVRKDKISSDEKKFKAREFIRKMLENEAFGVLAANEDKIAYTSLITFASSEDLKKLAFATPIDTKKFKIIEKNNNISILIDNRSDNKANINDIVAITSLGKAKILKDKDEIDKWSKILIDKHSYLDDFIRAGTSSIVLVDISKYYYVTSFQEVIEWIP